MHITEKRKKIEGIGGAPEAPEGQGRVLKFPNDNVNVSYEDVSMEWKTPWEYFLPYFLKKMDLTGKKRLFTCY